MAEEDIDIFSEELTSNQQVDNQEDIDIFAIDVPDKKKVETEVGTESSESLEQPIISEEGEPVSASQIAKSPREAQQEAIIDSRNKRNFISKQERQQADELNRNLNLQLDLIASKKDLISKEKLIATPFSPITEIGYKFDNDDDKIKYDKLTSQQKIIKNTQKYLKSVAKGDTQTAMERFWDGIKTTDVANTLSIGASQMANDAEIYMITNKLVNEGEASLTEEEKGVLLLNNISSYARELASKDRSFSVGSGIAESIPFMASMVATSGAGGATSKVIQGTSKAIYRKLLANLGEAGVRSLIMPNTYAKTMERMTADTDMDLQVVEMGEEFPEAFAKAFGENTIETFAEVAVGKGLEKVLSPAAISKTKLFKGSKFSEVMDAVAAKTSSNKALQAVSMQDPISEYGEEIFSGVFQPIVTGDGSPADFFEAENLIRTALITGVMTTSMRAPSNIVAIRDYSQIKKGISSYNALSPENKIKVDEVINSDDVDLATTSIMDIMIDEEIAGRDGASNAQSLIKYISSIKAAQKQAKEKLSDDNKPTYQIGNKVFSSKDNFIKEFEKQKKDGNIQPVSINNDNNTATQVESELRGGVVDGEDVTQKEDKAEVEPDENTEDVLNSVPEKLRESVKSISEKEDTEQLSAKEQQIKANYADEIQKLRDIQKNTNKTEDAGKDNEGDIIQEGIKKSYKQERVDKRKNLENIRKKYKDEIKKAETPDEGKKILRKMFNDVRKVYAPKEKVGQGNVVSYGSGIKSIDDNYKNIIKKINKDIDSGLTIDKIIDKYTAQVDRIEKTALKAKVRKEMAKPSKNKITVQTLREASRIVKKIDSIDKEIRAKEKQKISEEAERIQIVNPKLSKAEAIRMAERSVEQEFDADFEDSAKGIINTETLKAKAKNVKNIDAIQDFLSIYIGRDLNSLSETIDDIAAFREKGREEYSKKKQERVDRLNEVMDRAEKEKSKPIEEFLGLFTRTELRKGITRYDLIKKALTKKGDKGNMFKNIVDKILSVHMVMANKFYFKNRLKTLETINKLLTNEKGGGVAEETLTKVARAEADKNQILAAEDKTFYDSVAKVLGIKINKDKPFDSRKKVAKMFLDKRNEVVSITLPQESANKTQITRGELWSWYQTIQNEDVKTRMLSTGQITETTIAEINDLIESEDVAINKAMRESIDRMEELLGAWSAKYDIPFTRESNYWPTSVEKYDNTQISETDDGVLIPKPNWESILKERKSHSETYDMVGKDAYSVMTNYVMTVARATTSTDAVDMANAMLRAPSVKKTLRAFGLYNIYANRLATALGYPNKAIKSTEIGAVSGRVAKATLAYKPMQFFKQSTSALAGLEEASKIVDGESDAKVVSDFMKDLNYAVKNYRFLHNMMMKTSPEYRMRMENWYRSEIDLSIPKDEIAGKLRAGLASVGSKGMLPTKWGDAAGILLGYYPVYKKALRNGLGKEKALQLFERYDRTQQAQLKAHRAEFQDTDIAKVFTMWQSTAIAYMNKADQAKIDLWKDFQKTGKINKRHIMKLLLYRNILNGLFTIVGNTPTLLFGSTDDDELFGVPMEARYKSFLVNLARSQVLGNMNAIPLVADVMNIVYNKAVGINWRSSGTPLLGALQRFERGFDKASSAIKEDYGVMETSIDAALLGVDAVSGAGLYNVKEIGYNGLIKGAEAILEGDEWEGRKAAAHTLSIPKSQIDDD